MRFFHHRRPRQLREALLPAAAGTVRPGGTAGARRPGKYFLLHAPRQTGKTTCLLALAKHLNQIGQYHAVYANIEGAQAHREDVDKGIATVVTDIAAWAYDLVGDAAAVTLAEETLATITPASALGVFLSRWCQQLDKPLVLMLDEVDALVGDTLISLLRQLRAGYPKRLHQFPTA
ncbi:hypothetical protein [Candidatus Amarolinea dominans]|uniref:hypothetical protein n=1 Tax=Candidatus Amarolinea dominans TaxID=3140696 RepID=UPI0031CC7BAA